MLKDHRVLKVLLGRKELQVLRVHKVLLGHKVQLDLPDLLVRPVCKVLKVSLDRKVHKELLARKVHKVLLDRKV